MNIYEILSTKPFNKHYLDRYIKFIKSCQVKNSNIVGYTEKHHICPKAKDMFPEYKNIKKHNWNYVVLTARQHFIAHILLWKVYRNKSMTLSLYLMTKLNDGRINSKTYEILKKERAAYISKYFPSVNVNKVNVIDGDGNIIKITREKFILGEYVAQHANSVVVSDGDKKFRISIDDPRYLSGDLYGHTKGKTFAKDDVGNGYYVSSSDIRLKTGELKGNNAGTITINNGLINKRISPLDTIPEGWCKGSIHKSSKGSIWINNGITAKMHIGHVIPNGWKKGRKLS